MKTNQNKPTTFPYPQNVWIVLVSTSQTTTNLLKPIQRENIFYRIQFQLKRPYLVLLKPRLKTVKTLNRFYTIPDFVLKLNCLSSVHWDITPLGTLPYRDIASDSVHASLYQGHCFSETFSLNSVAQVYCSIFY